VLHPELVVFNFGVGLQTCFAMGAIRSLRRLQDEFGSGSAFSLEACLFLRAGLRATGRNQGVQEATAVPVNPENG
jgi:hypothetical protein